MYGANALICFLKLSNANSVFLRFNSCNLRFAPKVAPANSQLAPLLSAYAASFFVETTACNETIWLPLGSIAALNSLYDFTLPDVTVAISSFTNSSLRISVLAETNTPYACSIALRSATCVASSFVAPSPDTTSVTSSTPCAERFNPTKIRNRIRNNFFIILAIILC